MGQPGLTGPHGYNGRMGPRGSKGEEGDAGLGKISLRYSLLLKFIFWTYEKMMIYIPWNQTNSFSND